MKIRLKLEPSVVAKYYEHECDRYLFLKEGYVVNEDSSDSGSRKNDRNTGRVGEERTLTPVQLAGYRWEREFYWLLKHSGVSPDISCIDYGDKAELMKEPSWIRRLEKICEEGTGEETVYILQPTIIAPERQSTYPDVEVQWAKARPDLLHVKIRENPDGSRSAVITVLDIKLSSTPQMSHKIQIAIYTRLLEEILKDHAFLRVNTDFGYVINKPDYDESPRIVRDAKEGIIGNRIRLRGARIIVNDFMDRKILELEKALHLGFLHSHEVESDHKLTKTDVETFLKNCRYLVGPACRNCSGRERCSVKWNDHSILFLPYISQSAQEHLWRLKKEFPQDADLLHVDIFHQLVYEQRRVQNGFYARLRENPSWDKYLADGESFQKSLEVLQQYYRGEFYRGALAEQRSPYIKANGRSAELPPPQDPAVSVFLHVDEQYSDGGFERIAAISYCVLHVSGDQTENSGTVRFANIKMDDHTFHMADPDYRFVVSVLDRLEQYGRDTGVRFYVLRDMERGILKRIMYHLLYKLRNLRLSEAHQKVIRLLHYLQDEDTLLKRATHPLMCVESAVVSLVDEIRKIYVLPAIIDYTKEDLEYFFDREEADASTPEAHLQLLRRILDTVHAYAADKCFGRARVYSDDTETIEQTQRSPEMEIVSKLYYQGLYDGMLRDKTELQRYLDRVSSYYEFFTATYDPEDEVCDFEEPFSTLRVDNKDKAKRLLTDDSVKTEWTLYESDLKTIDSFYRRAIREYDSLCEIRNHPRNPGGAGGFPGYEVRKAADFPELVRVRSDFSDRRDPITIAVARGFFPESPKTYSGNLDRMRKVMQYKHLHPLADQLSPTEILFPATEEVDGEDSLRSEESIRQMIEHGMINVGGAETGFTASQQEALRHVCRFRDTVVQGPPGTGKTDFIARCVVSLFRFLAEQRGEEEPVRILLTSNSHAAIINMVNKIYDLAEGTPVLRDSLYKYLENSSLGGDDRRLKIDEGHMIYKFWNREEKEYQTLIRDGNTRFAPGEGDSLVIGMTAWRCFEDGKYWWGDGKRFGNFDLVILDEASQLRLDLGIWAIGLRKKTGRTMIVGDDEQLSAIVAGRYEQRRGETDPYHSVFDYFRSYYAARGCEEQMICRLNENFRMNETILSYSRKQIYGERYTSFNEQIGHQLLSLSEAADGAPGSAGDEISQQIQNRILNRILDQNYPLVVCYLKADSPKLQVEMEQALVKNICMGLYERMDYDSVESFFGESEEHATPGLGIVVPHLYYRDRLKSTLTKAFSEYEEADPDIPAADIEARIRKALLVDTVDKLQGQEREAIIVSYGVADPELINREAEFIYSRNRLNVALTRAKKKMIVFLPEDFAAYSPEILRRSNEKLELGIEYVAGLKDFMQEDGDRLENQEISGTYLDQSGREQEYSGWISIYRKPDAR